ncbi:MAG: NAD(P)H-hydrate dehydratase [Gemmatimonadota bacterium]
MSFPPVAEWWRHAARTVWLPTSEEMAELDGQAAATGTIPERALIENAGREVAHLVQARWPEGPVVALAGSGHNGADALVALRCLSAWGRPARAMRVGSRAPRPEVLRDWEIPLEGPEAVEEALAQAGVVLDGMLGTGASGPPRDPLAAIIRRANGSGLPIVAVDGPSGADFTTGEVAGECVRAALTVALGWPKLGLLRFPAREMCGDLLAVEIGFPAPARPPGARLITAAWVRDAMLAARSPDAHKGESGYLTLVAGQNGMAGAAVLAARSAVRGGAGIVRVVSDPANREILQSSVPEALFVPWNDPAAVAESVDWCHALAIGPGLGRGPTRRSLVEEVLHRREGKPVLVDADGLYPWSGQAEDLTRLLGSEALVTPHPGELARLLGTSVEEVVRNPDGHARGAASLLGSTVLLKGAPSVVATPGMPLRVSSIATPALATGGTGDVLTGLAGAYLAAGAPPVDAASAALLVSGLAAAAAPAAVGHSAADLPERVPHVRRQVERPFFSTWGGVLFASPSAPEG